MPIPHPQVVQQDLTTLSLTKLSKKYKTTTTRLRRFCNKNGINTNCKKSEPTPIITNPIDTTIYPTFPDSELPDYAFDQIFYPSLGHIPFYKIWAFHPKYLIEIHRELREDSKEYERLSQFLKWVYSQ